MALLMYYHILCWTSTKAISAPIFLDLHWWPPSCVSISVESQWPFESAEYGLGGREASPVLISHMQPHWQYSLHLSTIEPSLIQETTSDGTPASGVLWDQQRNPALEQMQGTTHKHKYFTKINLSSGNGLENLEIHSLNVSKCDVARHDEFWQRCYGSSEGPCGIRRYFNVFTIMAF